MFRRFASIVLTLAVVSPIVAFLASPAHADEGVKFSVPTVVALPECTVEDASSGPADCYWNDGSGQAYVVIDGTFYYHG